MDYHAWMVLQKSIGNLDYGNVFNQAVAPTPRENRAQRFIASTWQTLRDRLSRDDKALKRQTASTNNNCC